MESTIEAVQQVASDELDKAKARFIGGRSIDRDDSNDVDENVHSDDEGMIEEIVTTVEEDKDLECKVKKKIETKKTVAEDPETHNKITKVVKTEVTEITRTITINDQHDLERAKRELGIDDVTKLLPSTQIIYNIPTTYNSTAAWVDHPRLTQVQEKYYEPANEIVTSGDFPSDSPIKQHSPVKDLLDQESQQLAEATTVGRGPVVETVTSTTIVSQTSPAQAATTTSPIEEQKAIETKKKKKSSLNLCSCTRSSATDYDEEQRKQKAATIVEQKSKQKKKASVPTTNVVHTPAPIQGQSLISKEIKQLIADKKSLLIDYIHSKIFVPAKLLTSDEQDTKSRQVSARLLELLHDDRCSSWTNLFDQLKTEYAEQLPTNTLIQPMVNTYENLLTTKQSNLLNTFETIHNEKDVKNSSENTDYLTIVQTCLHQQTLPTIAENLVEQQTVQSNEKVIDDNHEKQQPLVNTKEIDMTDDTNKNLPIYNEEQITKALGDISPHKPITLAEAIAYQYIDLEDPKLGLSNDTIQRIKSLFRPLSLDDESTLNLIRIKRAGQYLADFNLAESNAFEKFHLSEPFIYQLQQSFEPTLDFNEKQFRSLTDAILKNKEEYSNLQFDIGRSLIPAGDLKESSTNDFSQSDSGYSMTTATYESLAGKVKNEFETINEPYVDQSQEPEKAKPTEEYERLLTLENSEVPFTAAEITEEQPIVHLEPRQGTMDPVDTQVEKVEEKPHVHLEPRQGTMDPVDRQAEKVEEKPHVHLEPRQGTMDPVDPQADKVEEKPHVHLEPRQGTMDPVDPQADKVEEKPHVHLEPRPATIEPVDVQPEVTPIIIPATKKEESTVTKTPTPLNLHGAAVELPEVELVQPGPLPTFKITTEKQKKVKEPVKTEKTSKVKKSTGGLCASCFGAKAAEKKKKEAVSESAPAPIEQKKVVEEEKKEDVSPPVLSETTIKSSPLPILTTATTTPTTEETTTTAIVNTEAVQEETTEKTEVEEPVLDDRLGATIEKLVSNEEPHYQLPSSEPVPPLPVENEYSVPESINTYDIPRPLESPCMRHNVEIITKEIVVHHEMVPMVEMVEVQESSKPVEQKVESTMVTQTETMPKVDVKDSATKGTYTLSTEKKKTKKVKEPKVKEEKVKEPKVKEPKVKGEKKSGLFSNLFRHSDRKAKAPALDLPDVENALTPTNEPREPHRHDSDPLRIPNTNLPQPDFPLPTYERPEVDMTSGQVKQSSEFTVPSVDLPPVPDLPLPNNEKPVVDSDLDQMKVPNVTLPEIHYSPDEIESIKLPELHLKTEKAVSPAQDISEFPVLTEVKQENEIEHLPTIENGLALASPVNDMLDIQVDHKSFPIETDYEIKTEATIPALPVLTPDETEIPVKPELLSTEQKYTITDTHFVEPPALPLVVERQTTESLESPPKLPELDFELPSLEPVPALSKNITVSPPSFDDDVPSTPPKVVSATEIVTTPIKTSEKQLIQPKADVKKKSSTLALCSCFGNKSNVQKEKSKTITTKEKSNTIAAPKADLPPVDMPVPSSNVSSTLKTKGSLRAPSNDLPPVDLTLPEAESVRLPAIHTHEKKRKAPKKSKVTKEEVPSPVPTPVPVETTVTTSPEAVVPVTTVTTTTTTTVTEVHVQQTSDVVPTTEVKSEDEPVVEKQVEEEIQLRPPTPPPSVVVVEEQIINQSPTPPPVFETPSIGEIKAESTTNLLSTEEKQSKEIKETSTVSKKSPSFEIKAPVLDIPELDLSAPREADAYIKHDESIITQSQSDSGLEAIISSHLQPSSTFSTNQTIEDLHQQTSMSSGLGSEKTIDSLTTMTKESTVAKVQEEKHTTNEPKRENSLVRHDFTRKISLNDESRAKLIFRQNELKKCLETEISKSIEDFDPKKDQKSLNKILSHAIDLVKDKKVTTYPELKQKLIIEHKHDAFIVDPVVRSLYCTIEKQGLDNLDTPEFPLAIRDMVRLPAKQAFETAAHINREVSEEPARISAHQPSAVSACLTCGRSKSKPKVATTPKTSTINTTTGLLDERRRLQLNVHRNELGTILRDHIQSSQPPLRQFAEHPKEVEKILRKTLGMVTQPKVLSYEQIRNDLKTEYKTTFYLVDPIIDIVRDTFDHCDITQMNEKTNLDILDSNISQTAQLYNQSNNQPYLLTSNEYGLLKSNQLSWLTQYLIDNELKEKKSTKKQTKELNKILTRTLEILSLNLVSTWDELNSQLRREFSKAHDLCDRAVELLKQAQKDGLLLLSQSPNAAQQDVTSINIINGNGKRRLSSLLTDRARQNLKNNRKKIVSSISTFLHDYNKPLYTEQQIETYVNKAFHHLEEQKSGQFKTYNDLKDKLKKDFKHNHEKLIDQIVDVIEQVHATNQFDDLEKPEVQTLMKDRLEGKPLVIKEMYVSLPPRVGAYGASKHEESSRYLSTSVNGDQTLNSSTSSHRIGRGLSWREANERARILFYRGKHPAIHYDEQAAAFDVRMLLETTAGGTQEIPVTDSDVHELLNSCGVQWDGVNIISLVDHSEDVVRAAEQAALKVIREKGLVDLRTPPSTRNTDENDEHLSSS